MEKMRINKFYEVLFHLKYWFGWLPFNIIVFDKSFISEQEKGFI